MVKNHSDLHFFPLSLVLESIKEGSLDENDEKEGY